MNDLTPEDISEIRLKIVEVEFRAKSDESFLQQLREDPVGVLQAQGFDDPMVQELAAQLTGDYGPTDVRASCSKCDPFTCLVTGCCFFTTVEPEKPKA